MGLRTDLDQELRQLLGSSNVYFQPPASLKMKYPCIVYKKRGGNTRFAGNKPYKYDASYDVTVIDRDPDSEIPRKIAMHFPMCVAGRCYTSDNLNHDTFVLYY